MIFITFRELPPTALVNCHYPVHISAFAKLLLPAWEIGVARQFLLLPPVMSAIFPSSFPMYLLLGWS